MTMKRNSILLVWLAIIFVFCGKKMITANETTVQMSQKELFDNAMSLREEGKKDAAMDMLKKIMDTCSNDELKYTDAMIEQCVIMRDMNNYDWKMKAVEAQRKVKILLRTNYTNPEYWLVYAKFAALVDEENHLTGAFKKAFFYKPNFIEGYILKGDLYSYFAKNTSPSSTAANSAVTKKDNAMRTRNKENSLRYIRGVKAKDAYYVALNSMSLDNKKKSYVFYKKGELEHIILSNKAEAIRNWKKAAEFDPDGIYGKISKERLEIHE